VGRQRYGTGQDVRQRQGQSVLHGLS
jgi:hypothetical protein